jgi:hypothetical protein
VSQWYRKYNWQKAVVLSVHIDQFGVFMIYSKVTISILELETNISCKMLHIFCTYLYTKRHSQVVNILLCLGGEVSGFSLILDTDYAYWCFLECQAYAGVVPQIRLHLYFLILSVHSLITVTQCYIIWAIESIVK